MSDVEIIGTFNTTLFVESANKKHEAISGMDAQQQPLEIMLTDIKRIDVLSDNPQFTQVNVQ